MSSLCLLIVFDIIKAAGLKLLSRLQYAGVYFLSTESVTFNFDFVRCSTLYYTVHNLYKKTCCFRGNQKKQIQIITRFVCIYKIYTLKFITSKIYTI